MKLKRLLLLTTAIGACASLLLAADMYRRIQDAHGMAALDNLPLRPDSVLVFGLPHAAGLVSVAFLFLSIFLLLIGSLRDPALNAALDEQTPESPRIQPAMTVTPIAEVAALAKEPLTKSFE